MKYTPFEITESKQFFLFLFIKDYLSGIQIISSRC